MTASTDKKQLRVISGVFLLPGVTIALHCVQGVRIDGCCVTVLWGDRQSTQLDFTPRTSEGFRDNDPALNAQAAKDAARQFEVLSCKLAEYQERICYPA
jgi:hypothetical protein